MSEQDYLIAAGTKSQAQEPLYIVVSGFDTSKYSVLRAPTMKKLRLQPRRKSAAFFSDFGEMFTIDNILNDTACYIWRANARRDLQTGQEAGILLADIETVKSKSTRY